ncbi:hypothetical protein [Tateyamaria sp. syn59]|uniref:hypothetical protein n=1 Tax=Tateyamaria sp. syn59 TaxID=2576942 RepID=UPI0011BDAEE7|nr:hypothetical protein [Tateyamaria sp. syn59]
MNNRSNTEPFSVRRHRFFKSGRFKFSLLGIGLIWLLAANWIDLTWWWYLPGFVMLSVGLLLLGAFNMDADRSGFGADGR